MLKLCGFAASNYYNKVKLALLEKGVPFEEVIAWMGETDAAASPLGKVPYVLTDEGPISESTVILEYLEQRYPQAPAAEQRAFEALVELQDPQLLAYLMGRERPQDPEQLNVIAFFGGLSNAGG